MAFTFTTIPCIFQAWTKNFLLESQYPLSLGLLLAQLRSLRQTLLMETILQSYLEVRMLG